MLPKKRDNGLSHGLELLQDEEVPRLGKLHQAHHLADLIAESTAIAGRGTAVIPSLNDEKGRGAPLPPVGQAGDIRGKMVQVDPFERSLTRTNTAPINGYARVLPLTRAWY